MSAPAPAHVDVDVDVDDIEDDDDEEVDETAALRAELLRARAKAYELHRVYADLRDLRAL